jgi:hypothetical protein
VAVGLTLALGSRHSQVAVVNSPSIDDQAPQVAAVDPAASEPQPAAEEKAAAIAAVPVAPPLPPSADDEKETAEPAPVEKKAVEPPAEPEKPAARLPLVIKRRSLRTDEELRRELILMSEVSLYQIPAASRKALTEVPKTRKVLPEEMPDFGGLPMRMGVDCQLGKDYAESLQVLSRKMRNYMASAATTDGIDTRLSARSLRSQLSKDGAETWQQPEAIPTITQMMMPEGRPARLLLVELLANITDARATAALAQRALFDLSSDVRAAAIQALRDRPREEFEPILLAGLRYPWAPAADHAAEALVALQDKEVVPTLVKMLREPDPSVPYLDSRDRLMVREVVRINHLSNCTMCHASSLVTTDPVRGRVPSPSEPLPPPVQYYDAQNGIFVRADVTYLKQDFSVPQPVAHPGPWPTSQRYDYLVRTRRASNAEKEIVRVRGLLRQGNLQEAARAVDAGRVPATALERRGEVAEMKYDQRDSVLFALRELTGKDAGYWADDWEKSLPTQKR